MPPDFHPGQRLADGIGAMGAAGQEIRQFIDRGGAEEIAAE